MARPQANNADYFPHYNSMRNHRKVKMLRNKFGNILGYAFWSMILEYLTEHDGLEWEYSEIEIEMFASELGVSAAEMPPLIDYCLKIGLLSKSDSNFIYSESLNENLEPVFVKRKREREKSKDRKRMENGMFLSEKPTGDGVSAAEMPQSRVEYSKEEESKEVSKETIVGLPSATPTVDKPKNNNSISERLKKFIENFNEIRSVAIKEKSKFQAIESLKEPLNARLREHDPKDMIEAIKKAFRDKTHIEQGFANLTPEYILRPKMMQKYVNMPYLDKINSNGVYTPPKPAINHDERG